MEKRLLDALSFDSWNLAVPKLIVKNKAAVDAHGCVLYFVHTRVGFGVARSDD